MNLDHKWLKRKFSIIEPDFYKKRFENNIEGQDIKTYENFVIPIGITTVNISMRNYLLAPNKEKIIASDDKEYPKDLELSSDKKKTKEKFVAPISGKP